MSSDWRYFAPKSIGLILDGSVVGHVSQADSCEWLAYGCREDWEDTPLGSFRSDAAARQAIEKWVRTAPQTSTEPAE